MRRIPSLRRCPAHRMDNTRVAKLIFVNRYFYPDHSATSQLLTDLAFDLADAGAQVVVITGRQRYDDPGATLVPAERINGVTVCRIRTTRFGRSNLVGRALDYLTFYLSAWSAIRREAAAGDVIIAKTDPPLISVVAAAAARTRGAALVNWIQDLFPEVGRELGIKMLGGGVGKLLTRLRNWSIMRARFNVVLGDLMAQRLSDMGVDRRRIKVIHNWVADDVTPVSRESNPLRREWGLEHKFVVMYSGNLGRAHEFDTILAAAGLLRKQRDIIFLFIGGGAKLAYVRQQAEQRELNNILVKPYQPREQLSQSLSLGDVHLISLLPNLEGLIVPSKFYGILAVGRPAVYIGSSDGEVPRILARERCGYTVAIGDAYGLVGKLKELCLDTNLARRMGQTGRELFLRRYQKACSINKWHEELLITNGISRKLINNQKPVSEISTGA